MAGGFAHITVIATLRDRLKKLSSLANHEKLAVSTHISFSEIGAVGPDYPYLAFGHVDFDENHWADKMHYDRTDEPIKQGVRWLRQQEQSADRDKALAWLLGYAAHVGTDLTVHPVVQERVGPYAENADQHRICEMNQDAFIWQRRNLGDIGVADYFEKSIGFVSEDNGDLVTPVRAMWEAMLNGTYPETFADAAPNINAWHQGYRRVIDKAEEGHKLFPLSRHLLAGKGIVFPSVDNLDKSFLENLDTPIGKMHYNDIFEAAVENVAGMWSTISAALKASDNDVETVLADIPAANLDTGCYLANKDEHVFWRNA